MNTIKTYISIFVLALGLLFSLGSCSKTELNVLEDVNTTFQSSNRSIATSDIFKNDEDSFISSESDYTEDDTVTDDEDEDDDEDGERVRM